MGLRDKARESAAKTKEPAAPVPEEPEEAPPAEEVPQVAEEQPAPSPSESPPALEPSVTYLVEEERPELAYSLFLTATSQGMRGMIVSRTYPKNLRKALNLGDAPVYWLTNAMSEEAIGPKDLERLPLTIRHCLEGGGGQLVLIDSLEYLITNNKFVSVLRLIQTIRDIVAVHKAVCIVSLKSSTLEPSQLGSIQRELEVFSGDKTRIQRVRPEVENTLSTELA